MSDPTDLTDLSDKRLSAELDRLVELRDGCIDSIYQIRKEQARRKQAQIDKLQEELDRLS